jgi:hypothetical protein
MRAVWITLVVGLALLGGGIAIVASGAPPAVARASSAPATSGLGSSRGEAHVCQGGETLPAGTSAIRLLIHSPVIGPRVTVAVLAGGGVATEGTQGPGWTAGVVTVPVTPLAQTVAPVSVCFAFQRSAWPVGLTGRRTRPALAAHYDGKAMLGRVGIEYLRPGGRSWWSRVPAIVREMGLGHGGDGLWLPLLTLTLMASLVVLSSWLAVRELR